MIVNKKQWDTPDLTLCQAGESFRLGTIKNFRMKTSTLIPYIRYIVSITLCILVAISSCSAAFASSIQQILPAGDNYSDIHKAADGVIFVNTTLDKEVLWLGGAGLSVTFQVLSSETDGYYLTVENNDSNWHLYFPGESGQPSSRSVTRDIASGTSDDFSGAFTRVPDAGGEKIFEVRLYRDTLLGDELMNTIFLTVCGDVTAPSSVIGSPAPGTVVSGHTTVTWAAADDASGVQSVSLYVKTGGEWSLLHTAAGATGSYTANVSAPDVYQFKTVATDKIGRQEEEKAADTWVLSSEGSTNVAREILRKQRMYVTNLDHTHAIKLDGSLWAWGENSYGTFGDGTKTGSDVPVRIGVDNDWVAVTAAGQHVLAMKANGTLWWWGTGTQYGWVYTLTPQQLGTDSDWAIMDAGYCHCVAIKTDGSMWAWGNNEVGQLGDGTQTARSAPVRIGTDNDWVDVDCGPYFNYALKEDGSLWVWGQYFDCQLGGGNAHVLSPTRLGDRNDWTDFTAASDRGMGILGEGTMFGWGDNWWGQQGDGTRGVDDRTYESVCPPAQVQGDENWLQVFCSGSDVAAIKQDKSLWMWGRETDSAVPVRLGETRDWLMPTRGNGYGGGSSVKDILTLNEDGFLYLLPSLTKSTDWNAGDWDEDGLSDIWEFVHLGGGQAITSTTDTDGDGMTDHWEIRYGLNRGADDAHQDLDQDGLDNLGEFQAGSSPLLMDTDKDRLPDAWEAAYGLDPAQDDAEMDSDGDGASNIKEYQGGTDPSDSSSVPPLDGEVLWQHQSGESIFGAPAVARDGTVYLANYNGYLYALHEDGTTKWDKDLGSRIVSSPALARNGVIYVGSLDGSLYALTPDGTIQWEFSTDSNIESSPAVGGDGTVYVGATDGKLYALSPSGMQKWTMLTNSAITSSPSVAQDGTIYASSYNRLYAVTSKGDMIWSFPTGGGDKSTSIGADGTVYFGASDKNMYAVGPDGMEQWCFTTGGYIREGSPAIAADGTIYITSSDGSLYALNPNGTQKWRFDTENSILSSPTLDDNGVIYFGDNENLYAIYPDGSLKWRINTGRVGDSPATLVKGGTLYQGAWSGALFAIKINAGGPMDSAWPMFGRTPSNDRSKNQTLWTVLPPLHLLLLSD